MTAGIFRPGYKYALLRALLFFFLRLEATCVYHTCKVQPNSQPGRGIKVNTPDDQRKLKMVTGAGLERQQNYSGSGHHLHRTRMSRLLLVPGSERLAEGSHHVRLPGINSSVCLTRNSKTKHAPTCALGLIALLSSTEPPQEHRASQKSVPPPTPAACLLCSRGE